MSCSCNNGRAANAEGNTPRAPRDIVQIVVRDGSHPLACVRCLEKHIAQAYIYAREWEEARERETEWLLCVGNLGCAGEHARALGRRDYAARIKAARISFADGDPSGVYAVFDELAGGTEAGRWRLEAVGRLAVAEEALRRAGGGEAADRIREIRRLFAEETADEVTK